LTKDAPYKGLASRVDERRAENPERPVEVWAFDG
jgi:hypothetical protein